MEALLTDATETVGILKGLLDLSKGFLGFKDSAASQRQAMDFQERVYSAMSSAISAQQSQVALLKQVDELKNQIAAMETWDAEKQRYDLKAVHASAFAQVSKPSVGNGEPPHWLCPNCFEQRKKRHLQGAGPASIHGPESFNTAWKCQDSGCGAVIRVPHQITPESFSRQGVA